MRLTDEQRLRMRVAALDAAVHLATGGGRDLVNNGKFVTDVAADFEAWLTRTASPGGTVVTAEDLGEHDVTTVADTLGYDRCDTFWRNGDGQLHRCRHVPDHDPPGCVCACGSTPQAK